MKYKAIKEKFSSWLTTQRQMQFMKSSHCLLQPINPTVRQYYTEEKKTIKNKDQFYTKRMTFLLFVSQ